MHFICWSLAVLHCRAHPWAFFLGQHNAGYPGLAHLLSMSTTPSGCLCHRETWSRSRPFHCCLPALRVFFERVSIMITHTGPVEVAHHILFSNVRLLDKRSILRITNGTNFVPGFSLHV